MITLISDGMIYAGAGEALNFGWNWNVVSKWLAKTTLKEHSAPRLASSLSQAVNELYLEKPGDDATDLVVKIMPKSVINLLSGPPMKMEDDATMVHDFMTTPGKRFISGGTGSNIVARVLNRKARSVAQNSHCKHSSCISNGWDQPGDGRSGHPGVCGGTAEGI